MKHDEFKKWLDQNNLTLKEFSEITNLSYSGCAKWKSSGVPLWVDSWCKLYSENKNFTELKKLIDKIVKNQ